MPIPFRSSAPLFQRILGALYFATLILPQPLLTNTAVAQAIGETLGSAEPHNFFLQGNRLFFSATTPESGRELWVTNGLESGTRLVADIAPGISSSDPKNFAALGNQVFFVANDITHGDEVWRSNGAAGNASMLVEIVPGPAEDPLRGIPKKFIRVGNKLFILMDREVWVTEGTPGSTLRVLDPSSDLVQVPGAGQLPNGIIFLHKIAGCCAFGGIGRVTTSDGSIAGTLVPFETGDHGINFRRANSVTFFSELQALSTTDGTAGGTNFVQGFVDDNPNAPNYAPRGILFPIVAFGNLFFSANDGVNGRQLWTANGTTASVSMLTAMPHGDPIEDYTEIVPYDFDTRVLFTVKSPAQALWNLWVSDGTFQGTHILRSFNGIRFGGNAHVAGRSYFFADDGINGWELWRTDGTIGGTQVVRDINPSTSSAIPFEFTSAVLGGLVYFNQDDGHGVGPWITDGTVTKRLFDQCPDDLNKFVPATCGCGTPETDTDQDGTANCVDQCPNDATKVLPGTCGCGVSDSDSDQDGIPNCHDNCPADPQKSNPGFCGCGLPETDADGDGAPNCVDDCPNDANKVQPGICGCNSSDADSDGDGTPNCADACPGDVLKTAPGLCGCGTSDIDSDQDGTPNCLDQCPSDAAKHAPGTCGCGVPDVDPDNNGTIDCIDLCPSDLQKTAPGACGCGIPDTDLDHDGTPDCVDACQNDPKKIRPGTCGCNRADLDLNSNGVIDCKVNTECRFRIDAAARLLNKLKKGSNGQLTGAGLRAKSSLKLAMAELGFFVSSSIEEFTPRDQSVDISASFRSVNKKVRSALKTKSTFDLDKRAARKALVKFSALLAPDI